MLDELIWNSDARRKGEAAVATPDPTILHLSCLRQNLREATVTGLLKLERSPGGRRGDRIKGATGGPHTCSSLTHQGQEPYLRQSRRLRVNTKGSPTAGRGHAIRIPPPKHPDAQIRRIEGRTSTLAAGRTLAGSLTWQRRGAWPLTGGSLRRRVSHRAWATDLNLVRTTEGSGPGTASG